MAYLYKKLNSFISGNLILFAIIAIAFFIFSDMKIIDNNDSYQQERRLLKNGTMPGFIGSGVAVSHSVSSDPSQKIVQSSSLELEVDDVDKVKSDVEQLVNGVGGYIGNFRSYKYNDGLSYSLIIRIPFQNLQEVIQKIKQFGSVQSESFSSYDVTDSYQDTENQLKNLLARRDRLRSLMSTKTKNVKDILEVDKELNNVQNSIERLTRMKNKMDKDVQYSVLTLKLIPEVKIKDLSGAEWKFSDSWTNAVNSAIEFSHEAIDKLVLFTVYIPFIFIAFLIIFVFKKIRK